MSDDSLREAIKEVVNEVLATNEEITFKPWIIPNYNNILKINNPMKEEELKNVATLELKKGPFYCDWGTNINIPKTTIESKGIEVNKPNGSIYMDANGLSFDFGIALEYIKKGHKVCRRGWNGKGLYVKLEKGGDYEFSEILPYFVIKNTSNSFNTWVPSVSDLMADDWMIVD